MGEADTERATELGSVLLEVLRLLNKSEAESSTVQGLEHGELLALLRRGFYPEVSGDDLDRAIATLLGNRMVSELDDPEFAWDRGRTVGRRFALQLPGKEYLLTSVEKTGRIP
ncbi:MAG: hypothetical protein L3K02_09030 [Thermoplasmata archaeon]|nr:hypothetical protein [Thermoplasmata archaeon]